MGDVKYWVLLTDRNDGKYIAVQKKRDCHIADKIHIMSRERGILVDFVYYILCLHLLMN